MRGRFLAQKLGGGAEIRASIASWLIRHWSRPVPSLGGGAVDLGQAGAAWRAW